MLIFSYMKLLSSANHKKVTFKILPVFCLHVDKLCKDPIKLSAGKVKCHSCMKN